MKKESWVVARSFAVALVLLSGCTSMERITSMQGLLQAVSDERFLRLMAGDGLYSLSRASYADSMLHGVGEVCRNDSLSPFDGAIPIADITYIEARHPAGFSTIVAVGAGAAVAIGALVELQKETIGTIESGIGVYTHTPGKAGTNPGSGGSCPTVYAWDGNRDVLQGEAFAVAWGRAFSMTTTTLLPSLRAVDDFIRITIRNERPETHYHDALEVLQASVPVDARTVLDTRNRLLVLGRPEPAVDAMDDAGRTATPSLQQVDGNVWYSTLHSAHAGGTYTDRVDLCFSSAAGQDSGVIVVTAMNTDIFPVMLSFAAEMLGDRSLEFVKALEEDPEMIRLIGGWLDHAAMRVMVGDGEHWTEAGKILPEASAVPFTRGLPVNLEGFGDTVHVRLECLADVWMLDAVLLDRHPRGTIAWTPCTPIPATSSVYGDIGNVVGSADGATHMALPGDDISLTASAVQAREGEHIVWGLRATGYLHEWMPERQGRRSTVLAAGDGVLASLKFLLRHRGLLLPPIYERWKNIRASASR